MSNGGNDWGVSFSYIAWLDRLLKSHENVTKVVRTKDINFVVSRKEQNDTLSILCLNEYSMGQTMVQRAISEFTPLNIIYVGGKWNGFTSDAGDFCEGNQMGICNASRISRMLWKDRFWE